MTEVQKCQEALKAAKATARTAKKAAKPKAPLANHTKGISMERRPESKSWGVDHALLFFHDKDNTKLKGRLDPEDTIGQELRNEINTYAAENRVGKSKIRFDSKLGAWKGLAVMFPPRLRDLAGYTISE